jgi:hypothetical protein
MAPNGLSFSIFFTLLIPAKMFKNSRPNGNQRKTTLPK